MTRINAFLFYLILIELSLGGGGRLTAAGDVSMRMLLFSLAIISAILTLNKVNEYSLKITFLFVTLVVFNSWMGSINNAKTELLIEDIKSLSYFPILLFFQIQITSLAKVNNVVNIIKFASIVLSVIYIFISYSLQLGFIDSQHFYDSMFDSGEFVFRNEFAFVYKGFLFSSAGLFFLFFEKSNNKIARSIRLACSVIIVAAILMTYTRGLAIAIFISGFIPYLYFLMVNKKSFKILLWLVAISLISVLSIESIIAAFSEVRSTNIDDSDAIRVITIAEVFSAMTPLSMLIGHGFGIGVPTRPVHMEISYVEIFHKQGIIGLIFYLSLFFKIAANFLKIIPSKDYDDKTKIQTLSFMASSLFIYLQSASNPLLTNSIGISLVVLSLICTDSIMDKGKTISSEDDDKTEFQFGQITRLQ